MKYNLLFLLLSLSFSVSAQEALEQTDSVAPVFNMNVHSSDSIVKKVTDTVKEPALQVNKHGKRRGKNKKTEEVEYPAAVDNSAKLLAEADSLSMLYNPYNKERILYVPIVFFEYKIIPDMKIEEPKIEFAKADSLKLDFDDNWYEQLKKNTWFESYHINKVITDSPWLVPYNISMLPEPPKKYEVKPDISKNILVIEERSVDLPVKAPKTRVKTYNWIQEFDGALQFSQAYLSENWYQGGKNNVNMIANAVYNLRLNQAKFPNRLFELTAQYKLGLNSAPEDELRDYSINEDLFQVNAKFGLKATKQFYYSMNMQFRTQLLQNFKTNTWDLAASFLTPGELNVGIGMTYSVANQRNTCRFDASLSPVSYNMKICRAIDKMDPTAYGIDPGKHLGHEVGSSGECKVSWTPVPNITLSSRLYVFSDYDYLQGDLETTVNLSINKYLSTQIYAHLRYDDSAALDKAWQYWQFKEILSFGLQYKFRM